MACDIINIRPLPMSRFNFKILHTLSLFNFIQLHSSMYHSQCKLIFCVQKRTIKSSNVEMSKMNFRNFKKFQIFYVYRVKRVDIQTQRVLKSDYLA